MMAGWFQPWYSVLEVAPSVAEAKSCPCSPHPLGEAHLPWVLPCAEQLMGAEFVEPLSVHSTGCQDPFFQQWAPDSFSEIIG